MTSTAVVSKKRQEQGKLSAHSLWYKDAVIYEMHVRSFCDQDGDGVGDFKGLTAKLDYLQDLGVTAIWLLPFYPSPLRDDGYDIADYMDIHSLYGKMSEFRQFLREAHKRGLRVITELVVNHTSDQHPWFQKARRSPAGSSARNFYVWHDSPTKYKDTRIIFKDYEHSNWTWDHIAKAYYWHRFYSHQPDLNFDNPAVQKAIFQVLDFWMEMGVDGMRLDAVPYLFEREGTNCENLPEGHDFLKKLRDYLDCKYKDRMLLAEANQWPEDAVPYFGNGDECHMAFHFPIMPRMFMSIHMEDRYPIVDILSQTPAIPENCQWALFLRNHDELTLEMVTDEERDYMYRIYANDPQARINLGIRRRLAPLLSNNRRKIELMNGLLFSLPGTPILYYGDEIGMGDNIYLGDRGAVRTPMQWSGDRNAGFSKANPQKLYMPVTIDPEYHYETINVEAQQQNLNSLLWWTKRLIAIRKRFQAFGRGSIQFLQPDNRKVLVFIREYKDEKILVVANLSRFVQYVELDLSAYKDMTPVEIFGKNRFPKIGELPYFVTLGPHNFYWFVLEGEKRPSVQPNEPPMAIPQLETTFHWKELLNRENKSKLEGILSDYMPKTRWFGGKERKVKDIRIAETISFPYQKSVWFTLFIDVSYVEGESQRYQLPLCFLKKETVDQHLHHYTKGLIAQVKVTRKNGTEEGYLVDGLYDKEVCLSLLEIVIRKKQLAGEHGRLQGISFKNVRQWVLGETNKLDIHLAGVEQSNTSVIFGDQAILKIYRRVENGKNPDLEIGLFLTQKKSFAFVPAVGGYLEYQHARQTPATLGLLQSWVKNEGDAWCYTVDRLLRFYEAALSKQNAAVPNESNQTSAMPAPLVPSRELVDDLLGDYREFVKLLSERTAELHLTLAADASDPEFAPESFNPFYQRSLYQSIRNQVTWSLDLLQKRTKNFSEAQQSRVKEILQERNKIFALLEPLLKTKIEGKRIRCHGDYHLGQVLHTGKDFYVLDFEGEPVRSLQDRRIKRSPLRDVAGMIRSFHYAAYTALWTGSEGRLRAEDIALLEPWAEAWYRLVTSYFLDTYREKMMPADILPKDKNHFRLLLLAHLVDKTFYEVGYELRQRPEWIDIPIQGILDLLYESRSSV
ncbi:MAG: maltose alpha-D-glucosyltransferase [Candidatus Omnitrophica bacterium CG11_big_fil_rev_8_21_14_0_20_45_26]|uniref:Maltokinase n=1 Tax=Candidatus Abzuiibacterium crystallinum TaxID=1974748 RepID=A0A2H0LRD0_9BACT|nr:MAG: maltose alpha-D-glucosyltransferase [Candidatus Omnitrophica bacterium CG11_big_fil_rev_8_21_14_0_20_45_26]PIW64577.1 MAG: maltose alpha-D-glucosyltransferase [Candidatus Omnitrophica bacterium CG12_big_fil_rev_8_21_14_0_65_45_16]